MTDIDGNFQKIKFMYTKVSKVHRYYSKFLKIQKLKDTDRNVQKFLKICHNPNLGLLVDIPAFKKHVLFMRTRYK